MRHSDFVTLHADCTVKNNSPVEVLYQLVKTPLGLMIIGGDTNGLRLCDFVNDPVAYITRYKQTHPEVTFCQRECSLLVKAKLFLSSPFTLKEHIPVIVNATEFQLAVWKSVLDIPWGETSTYSKIAALAGYPSAIRAAGTAIGKNPVLVVIPCHRVIMSSGKCGGYLRGCVIKNSLLNFENIHKG